MLNTQEQVLQTIKKSNNILVTFKKNYDIDTVASAISLYLILKKLRKEVTILADNFTIPKRLRFLPEIDKIQSQDDNKTNKFKISLDISKTKIDEFNYEIADDKLNIFITPKEGSFKKEDVAIGENEFKYDLIITVDTSDIEYLGQIHEQHTEFFYETPIINLDHLAENERYGQINHVDLTATATTEIIHDLFFPKNINLMDEKIATCLLTGIIAKTKCFKTPQVSPKTLTGVSELIANGAMRDAIIDNLYRTKSLSTLKIWGKILMNLQYESETRHVWSKITAGEFISAGADEESLTEIIEELITNSPEAKIITLIYEHKERQSKAIIYADKNINALKLTKQFNPEGTKRLAIVSLENHSSDEAKDKIIGNITREIETIPSHNR